MQIYLFIYSILIYINLVDLEFYTDIIYISKQYRNPRLEVSLKLEWAIPKQWKLYS